MLVLLVPLLPACGLVESPGDAPEPPPLEVAPTVAPSDAVVAEAAAPPDEAPAPPQMSPEVVALAPGGAAAALIEWGGIPCDIVLVTLPGLERRKLATLAACPERAALSRSGGSLLLIGQALIAVDVATGTYRIAPEAPPTGALAYPDSFGQTSSFRGETLVIDQTWSTTMEGMECEGPCWGGAVERHYAVVDGAWAERPAVPGADALPLDPRASGSGSQTSPARDDAAPSALSTAIGITPDCDWAVRAGPPRVASATWDQGEAGCYEGAPVAVEGAAGWTVLWQASDAGVVLDRTAHYLVARMGAESVLVDLRGPSVALRGQRPLFVWPAEVPAPTPVPVPADPGP